MSLLKIQELNVRYGGIHAVRDLNIDIQAGELVTLIGANGAGKTSTLRTLVGMEKRSAGQIQFDGLDTNTIASHDFVRHGLVMVPEGRGIFGKLTIVENLEMGAYHRQDSAQIARDMAYVFELFPRLAERKKQISGTLSGGEQQMLAIGRAILSQPKLLLLDEPSMGLAPIIVQGIFEIIKKLSQDGVTILLVEQNAKLALEISHRGYVMESGRITLSGDAASLLADERVKNAYLGE
jgi:branched-chain amino acid transport system ATP-binding protein